MDAGGSLPVTEVVFLPTAETDYEEAMAWHLDLSAMAAVGFEAAAGDAVHRVASLPDAYAQLIFRMGPGC